MKFPKPSPREKARKPLARKTRLKARSTTRKRNGEDPAYLEVVRQMPCFLELARECEGPIHAHHAIHRSQGGIDRDAIPLCQKHHREWHEASGYFYGLNKTERRLWAGAAISYTQTVAKRMRAEQKRGW